MKYIYYRNCNMNISLRNCFEYYKITLSSRWVAMTEQLGGGRGWNSYCFVQQ